MSGLTTPPSKVKPAELRYNSEMIFIGQRCHWHECHREDFLPFRCPDCKEAFCSEHFKTDEHQCPTPSQSFVVPQCPLCHEPPRKWRRNEDPNLAMDAHLTADRITGKVECSAINLDGLIASKEKRPKREGECAERRCHKLMVVPIRCPSCSKSFCPSHRAPNQHSCSSLNLPSVDSKPAAEGSSRAAGSASALKTFPSANQSKGSPQSTSAMHTKSSALSSANPLRAISAATTKHKTEKRATSEQASAYKALQIRQKKGLLSQAEEVKLAELMAMDQKSRSGATNSGDCIVC